MNTTSAIAKIKRIIQSQSLSLTAITDTLEECIEDSLDRYNDDVAITQSIEIFGNGTKVINMPSQYVRDFTSITDIEFPTDKTPPQFIDRRWWGIHRLPTGSSDQLFLSRSTPSTDETVQLHMSIRMTAISDVRVQDERAVLNLAAYHAVSRQAQKETNTSDDGRGVDFVDHQDKSTRRIDNGQIFLDYYEQHIYGNEDNVKAAMGMDNWDSLFGRKNPRVINEIEYT